MWSARREIAQKWFIQGWKRLHKNLGPMIFFLPTFLLANVPIDKFQNVSDGHISENALVGKEGATFRM